MLNYLLTFSLRNRWAVVATAAVLMGIGYWCFTLLKIEAYPDIADANVIIISKYDGRAAEEVEQQVTIPIERVLNNMPRVIDRRSRTIFGLSVVQLTFQDGTDDYFARQQVIERLSSANLPEGVAPELAPLTTAVGEIYRYVVEAPPTYTPMQLRDLQDWVIVPYLLQVPGIADITTFGGPKKEYHVLTSPEKLRKYNLTLRDVMEAVEQNNQNTGGNIVERGEQGFAVRGLGAIKHLEDIQNIVLTAVNGIPVFLRDVASVEVAPPPPSGVLGYTIPSAKTNVASATEGIILLRRGENPSEVLGLLKEQIKQLEANELPQGVHLRVLYDRSFLIDHSLETVAHTLFEGISIVMIILVLLLGSLRSALVVTVMIPFSLLFAFILMKMAGIPANLLSLGAIDFGIIVDGACVMVEHLMSRYRSANDLDRSRGIAPFTLGAAREVVKEIFFSVGIIILAYMPILLMTRVEGKLFSPMALTLSFAVIGSLLGALTIIPVLMSFVFKKAYQQNKIKEHHNVVLDALDRGYEWLLKNVLLKKYKASVVIGIATVLLLISFGGKLGTEFLPELDEGSIFMRAFLPSGVTIQKTTSLMPAVRETIAKNKPVKSVITQAGRNDDGTDPFPANRMEILVALNDYHEWSDSISKKDLIRTIQTDLQRQFPGVFFSSGQPIIDQVMEIVTGSAADLAVSIVGNDLNLMRSKADSIAKIVRETSGSVSVNLEQEGPQAQLTIQINREQAARFGINITQIETMIEAAIGGKVVTTLYDSNRRYDVLVRYLPENRNSIEAIQNLQVPAPSGALIPMRQLADVRFTDGQTNIYRINGKRMITVRTNIRGRDQGSFVEEISQRINKELSIPKGYQVIYGGQYENLARAGKGLLLTIPLTIVLVFLVLFMLFGNLRHTAVTFTCILFALAGGIIALLIRDYHFNVSAGVGFVSIFGISVMAGIVLVSAFNRAPDLDTQSLNEKTLQISVRQLRPLLSILVVAIVGLIPAATSTGIGSDVQRPLATVIIGGLTSTLLFTPLLLPPLYQWIEGRAKKKKAL